jgi:hypothetical protein
MDRRLLVDGDEVTHVDEQPPTERNGTSMVDMKGES